MLQTINGILRTMLERTVEIQETIYLLPHTLQQG